MFTNILINKTSPIFRKSLFALFSIAIFGLSSSVGAQETSDPAVSSEVAYILKYISVFSMWISCHVYGSRFLYVRGRSS